MSPTLAWTLLICRVRLYFCLQRRGQKGHLNCGNFPHSYLTWRERESLLLYVRRQWGHWCFTIAMAPSQALPKSVKTILTVRKLASSTKTNLGEVQNISLPNAWNNRNIWQSIFAFNYNHIASDTQTSTSNKNVCILGNNNQVSRNRSNWSYLTKPTFHPRLGILTDSSGCWRLTCKVKLYLCLQAKLQRGHTNWASTPHSNRRWRIRVPRFL